MLLLFRSNRTERLLDALGSFLAEPQEDPFAREVVVVQGAAMQRWVSIGLARRFGVWANCEFPYPRRFVEKVVDAVLVEPWDREAHGPEAMAWALARIMSRVSDRPGFEALSANLQDDPKGVKLHGVARQVAETFDRYVIYRPEMILRWERDEDPRWDAALWRELVGLLGPRHLARVVREVTRSLAGGAEPPGLPRRVAVFGVESMPRYFVELLAALAEVSTVAVFLPTPSPHYLGFLDEDQGRGTLLSSCGRLARDMQVLLERHTTYHEPELDLFAPMPRDTLLHHVQADLYEALDPRSRPGVMVDPDDRSLRIHACAGPMRELQVLHDQLTLAFEELPGLTPEQVVVMVPDMRAYAPLVHAVFDNQPKRLRLPYTLVDRTLRSDDPAVDGFCRVLGLLGGRFTATGIMDALDSGPVRAALGLGEDDVELVRRWVLEAGARWARDEDHREAEGQPRYREYTWRFAMDRLVAGAGVPGEAALLFGRVLPYDDIEGQDLVTLGKLLAFLRVLGDADRDAASPKPLSAWGGFLTWLARQVVPEREASASAGILAAIQELVAHGERFPGDVHFEVVRSSLLQALDRSLPGRGFLAEGITFCELAPMRAIPFRVVCVLGLDDGAFPRTGARPSFDRMADAPMPGDRDQRDDDRYTFLSAILSARDRLHLSYTGLDPRGGTAKPRSVVLEELLDHLNAGFDAPEGMDVMDVVTVTHPITPFAARAFSRRSRPELWSHSPVFLGVARALTRARRPLGPVISRPLEREPALEPQVVSLSDVERFLRGPVRYFVRHGLMAGGLEVDGGLEDREPVELGPLQRYGLASRLLVRNVPLVEEVARGTLPLGAAGAWAFFEVVRQSADLADELEHQFGGHEEVIPVRLELGDLVLAGDLGGVGPVAAVLPRPGSLDTKTRLVAWVRHLVLSVLRPERARTVLVGSSKGLVQVEAFPEPVPDARAKLRWILDLYRDAATYPVPMIHPASFEYATVIARYLTKGRAKTVEPAKPMALVRAIPKEVREMARRKARAAMAPSQWASPRDDRFGNLHMDLVYGAADPVTWRPGRVGFEGVAAWLVEVVMAVVRSPGRAVERMTRGGR